MLKELCQISSPSGYEFKIRDYILQQVKPLADHIEIDALGNLIASIKGVGENKKKIMCAAHMDEIGVQVLKLTSDGFAKIRSLGGVSPVSSYMQRIKFDNGLVGVVSNYKSANDINNKDFSQCYVDFGLSNKECLEKIINVGEIGTFMGDYIELSDSRVMSKALDDRAGCYILIKAMEKLHLEKPYHDVNFVFTVQEEVGLKGARVVAEYLKPDLGIAVDITGSFDVPGDMEGNAVIGKGAAIKISDASVICDKVEVRKLVDCAVEESIDYQLDIMTGGGTDAGAINTSGHGVKVLGISIPTRYGHSPSSIVSLKDIKACHDLLEKFLRLS